MGVNRKFDFRRVWKFCWDLSNVISGGNWLFRWGCVFSGGTLYPSVNHVSTLVLLSSFYFTLKLFIYFARFFNGNSLIVAWRFRIQDSRFKKKIMKMYFKKKKVYTRFLKIKACAHNSPIINLLFHLKISTLLCRGFSWKSPKCGLLYFLCLKSEDKHQKDLKINLGHIENTSPQLQPSTRVCKRKNCCSPSLWF